MKNEKGFTLIEMLIVLLVITVLLLITIPNVTKHNSSIQEKGCEGLINMVQAQVTSYQIDHKKIPTLGELETGGYLRSTPTGDHRSSEELVSVHNEGCMAAVMRL